MDTKADAPTNSSTLWRDLNRFGPAPTLRREGAVLLVNLTLVAAILFIFHDTPRIWVVPAVIVVVHAVRAAFGWRRWKDAS